MICGIRSDGERGCVPPCPAEDFVCDEERPFECARAVCIDGRSYSCAEVDLDEHCDKCGCLDPHQRCVAGQGCVPLADVGDACDRDRDCMSDNCHWFLKKCMVPIGAECTQEDCDICIKDLESGASYCSKTCGGYGDCGRLECTTFSNGEGGCVRPCDGDNAALICDEYSCIEDVGHAELICSCEDCVTTIMPRPLLSFCNKAEHCQSQDCFAFSNCFIETSCVLTGFCSATCTTNAECGDDGACVQIDCTGSSSQTCSGRCAPRCPGSCQYRTCNEVTAADGEMVSVCDPRVDVGNACETARECITGNCVAGRCAIVDGSLENGDSCRTDAHCRSGRCHLAACRGEAAQAEPCSDEYDCADGTCMNGLCSFD